MKEQSIFLNSRLLRHTSTAQRGMGEQSFLGSSQSLEFENENENTSLVSQFPKKMDFRMLENQNSKTQKVTVGLRMEFEV